MGGTAALLMNLIMPRDEGEKVYLSDELDV